MNPLAVFIIVAVVIGALAHSVLAGIVIAAVVIVIWWRSDVRRHPRVRCPVCKGSGDHLSPFRLPWARRPAGACGHCGGKKGVPRPALRLIDNSERKKILAAIAKAKGEIRR